MEIISCVAAKAITLPAQHARKQLVEYHIGDCLEGIMTDARSQK